MILLALIGIGGLVLLIIVLWIRRRIRIAQGLPVFGDGHILKRWRERWQNRGNNDTLSK
jgi:hypothetical protein